ncbi:hypothetical protein ACFSLT_20635 [Novosphingobium resinovorum]
MSASSVPMAHASVSLVTSSEAPVQQRLPGGYRLGGGNRCACSVSEQPCWCIWRLAR